MDVLSEAVERAGKDYIDLRPLTRREDGKALSDKQIKRYLAGTHYPTGAGVDAWARIVGEITDANRFDYWRQAIERAEEVADSGEPDGERAPQASLHPDDDEARS
jgi:hypothetical protein